MPHELQRRWTRKCEATFSGLPTATSLSPNWWVQLGNKAPVSFPVPIPIPIPSSCLSPFPSRVISAEIFKLPKLVGRQRGLTKKSKREEEIRKICYFGIPYPVHLLAAVSLSQDCEMKSNEYEFPGPDFCPIPWRYLQLPPAIFVEFGLVFFLILFWDSLMSSFWKWYSRVKTLIRLARLKGVAGP